MLRVYSILYLERVWTRPANVIIRSIETSNSFVQQEPIATIIDNDQISFGSVNSVTLSQEERKKQEEIRIKEEQLIKEREERLKNEQEERLRNEQDSLKNEKDLKILKQERLKKEKELQDIILERQKFEQEEQLQRMKLERQREEEQRENIKLERQTKTQKEELMVKEYHPVKEIEIIQEKTKLPSTPTPSTLGDFSCSNSSSLNLFEKTSNAATSHETAVHPYKSLPPITSENDREYYDDDLSSDLDSEHIIDQLPTPPSTPNKFSPKRILHKAKSSINDDSVRNLGRRTSLFLEKKLNASSSDDFSIISLRRQSSKLSSKGKSFTKKLKRVLSFHQS